MAPEGSGVMILADGYPEMTTVVDSLLFERAKEKRLRLYIEYPSFLPGIEMTEPRQTLLERVVVTSDSVIDLEKCRFLLCMTAVSSRSELRIPFSLSLRSLVLTGRCMDSAQTLIPGQYYLSFLEQDGLFLQPV